MAILFYFLYVILGIKLMASHVLDRGSNCLSYIPNHPLQAFKQGTSGDNDFIKGITNGVHLQHHKWKLLGARKVCFLKKKNVICDENMK